MSYRCLNCGARYTVHTAWCGRCLEAGLVVIVGDRAGAAIDGVAEITDARALIASAWQTVVSAAYPTLALGPGALVVVHGASGAGKSTWAARALDTLAGPVVLASVEEPPGPTLASRLVRCAIKRPDFSIAGRVTVDQLVELARERKSVGLCIDSVQTAMFTPRELRHLLLVLPALRLLIAVSQQNKLGVVAGRNDLVHEADVVVEVDALQWTCTKSRYQSTPTLPTPVLTLNTKKEFADARADL